MSDKDLDNELENLLGPEGQEDVGQDDTPDGGGSADNKLPVGVKRTMVRLRKSRRELIQRAETAEQKLAEKDPKKEEPEQKPTPPPQPPAADPDADDKLELRLKGFSKEEIDFIQRNRISGESLLKTAENDAVMAGIQTMRSKAAAAKATPGSSNRMGGDVPKPKRPRDMTPKERAAMQTQIIERNRRSGQ